MSEYIQSLNAAQLRGHIQDLKRAVDSYVGIDPSLFVEARAFAKQRLHAAEREMNRRLAHS